jgi:hypothetical protein
MVHKLRSKENYYMKNNRLFQILPLALAVVVSGDAFGESETNSYAEPGFREDLQQGLVLIATSNAPVGAAGRAEIVAVNNNGTNSAVLFVKTTGLPNGSYTVSLTNLGGSQTYNLGSLNVATPTNEFGFGASGEQDLGHSSGGETSSNNWTNWVGQCAATNAAWTNLLCGEDSTNRFGTNVYQWYTDTLAVGSGSFALPSGLAQSNVAGVFVSDSGGNVDLTGDFTSVTNTTSVYVETVGLVPGTATKLQGQAILTLTTRNGNTLGSFKLSATGLGANQKLYLTANGTNIFKVYTSRSGLLTVNNLPRVNLVALKTLVATDVSGHVLFSVGF